MVLREGVVQVSGKNDSSTTDENVKLRLVFFLTLDLVIGLDSLGSGIAHGCLHDVVLFHEFVLDGFYQIFALIVVSDVSHYNSRLGWILLSHLLHRGLILAHQDDSGSVVEIPIRKTLPNA